MALGEKNRRFTEAYPYVGKAIKLKNDEKETEKTPNPSDVRYEIKFHPKHGMKLRIRTNIVKKVYLEKKLLSHLVGKVYHSEEIVNVFGDGFETKSEVSKKTQSLKDLHYYKFINPNEKAFTMYSMEGVITDYKYHGNNEHVWYPILYHEFAYPRGYVGLNSKWGSTPGADYETSVFVYQIAGFTSFKGKEVMKVEISNLPLYKTHINDNPNTRVPAKIKGFYYLEMDSGAISFFSITKKYNYKIQDSKGIARRVFFEYNSITY